MSPQSREDRLVPYLRARESFEELLLTGRKDGAIKIAEQFRREAEDQGDEDFRLLFDSLVVRVSQADHPRQIELLNEAVQWEDQQQLPREPIFYLYIGEYFSANQDYPSALAWYHEALKLDQRDAQLMRLMGVAILNQGDPETALKWFEAALTASENKDAATWREIAFTQLRLGEKEKALQSIDQAVAIQPEFWQNDKEKIVQLVKNELGLAAAVPRIPQLSQPLTPQRDADAEESLHEPAESDGEHDGDDDMLIGEQGFTVDSGTQGDDDSGRETPIGKIPPAETSAEEKPGRKNDVPGDSGTLLEKVRAAALAYHREALVEFQTRFLGKSKLSAEKAYWFFLRRCGVTSGGGHFLWNRGSGTIIDPGRDFLDVFGRTGASLADVRNIIVTNDNESHLEQFEAIRKLLLRGNLSGNVRFFLNLGAIQKLSGVIDLNDKSFSEGYLTLHAGAKYSLSGGGEIKALPAYHRELKSVDQAVGLLLRLDDSGQSGIPESGSQRSRRILYTSDTGLFPLTFSYDSARQRIVYVSDKHQLDRVVSRRYADEDGRGVDLMVLHFGAANVQTGTSPQDADTDEFAYADVDRRPNPEDLPELCCRGRLGYLGVREVITECKPKLAVVCEWDRVSLPLRTELCKLLQSQCDAILNEENGRPVIVPGDPNLVYDIFGNAIYDCVRCGWSSAERIDFAAKKSRPCSDEEMFYFQPDQKERFESMPKFFVDRYVNALEFRQELHFGP